MSFLVNPHNILNRWKNYFSRLLNVHRVSDVRQIEIHTPDPNPFEVEIAIAKLKRYKSPGSDQIPAELIKQEVKYYVIAFLPYNGSDRYNSPLSRFGFGDWGQCSFVAMHITKK
jgi:hypothetical protein